MIREPAQRPLIDSRRAIAASANAPEENAGAPHQGRNTALGQPPRLSVAVAQGEEVMAPIHKRHKSTLVLNLQGTIVPDPRWALRGTMVPMSHTDFLCRLEAAREASGLSERKIMLKAGLDLSTFRRLRSRGQKPGAEVVAKLEAALDLPKNHLMDALTQGIDRQQGPSLTPVELQVISVRGAVQAGVWHEALEWHPEDWFNITVPRDGRFPGVPRFGLVVRGDSMNRLYPDGTITECVRFGDLARLPKQGERVVVLRRSNEGFEATLKEYEHDSNGRHILWPRSYNPEFQSPIILEGELPVNGNGWDHHAAGEPDLVISALVIGSYRKEGEA